MSFVNHTQLFYFFILLNRFLINLFFLLVYENILQLILVHRLYIIYPEVLLGLIGSRNFANTLGFSS